MMKKAYFGLAVFAVLSLQQTASAQVLFSETFDDASSAANFLVTSFSTGLPAGEEELGDQVYAEFGFDYSATGASRLSSSIIGGTTPAGLPTGSPSGGGSTTGLLLAANMTDPASPSAINLFPILTAGFSATDPTSGLPLANVDYRMTFDFFGGVNDVGGTSEFLQIGAQSAGNGRHLNSATAPYDPNFRDSNYLEVNINGDLTTSDYIPFSTSGGSPQLDPAGFTPNTAAGPVAAFPGADYEVEGAPGQGWSQAEVRFIFDGGDGSTSETQFWFNGVQIAEATIVGTDFGAAVGSPWFGYTDFFGSRAGGDSPIVATPTLPGAPADADYDNSELVSAADYAIVRDLQGTSETLPNDVTPGTVDASDIAAFAANFGSTGSGGGPGIFDPFNASYVIIDNVVVEQFTATPAVAPAGSVPEPTSALLLALGVSAVAAGRRRS